MTRILMLAALLAACTTGTSSTPPTPIAPPAAVLNPAVTPATIRTTICVPGWTATVRPPAAYTDALKRQQIAARHYTDTRLSDYEEDHGEPLELGGNPTSPTNLWPEPIGVAHQDDRQEGRLRVAICNGTLSLDVARAQMWALKKAHGL